MHLFVGNLAKDTKISDLEEKFNKYGECEIKIPKVSLL